MKAVFNYEAVWLPGGHPASTTPAPTAGLPRPRLPPREHSAHPEAPPGFHWAPSSRGGAHVPRPCARPPSRLCGRRQESVASWGHLRSGRRGPALVPSLLSQPSPLDPDLTGSSVPLPVSPCYRLMTNYMTFVVGEVLLLILTVCSLAAIFPRVRATWAQEPSRRQKGSGRSFASPDSLRIDCCVGTAQACVHPFIPCHSLASAELTRRLRRSPDQRETVGQQWRPSWKRVGPGL